METPALRHLMGAYFHQDWNLDGTEAEVIDSFLTGEPQYAPLIAGEIEAVLAEHPEVQALVVQDEPGPRGQRRLAAYVVPREGTEPRSAASQRKERTGISTRTFFGT